MKPHSEIAHAIVSYDWAPKIGGAHSWLYEVYRRWPAPVQVLTVEPSADAATARSERDFDARAHGSLELHRSARPFTQLSLVSPGCVTRFIEHARALRRLTRPAKHTLVHALRSWPEGFTGLLCKRLHRNVKLVTYAHGEEILIAKLSTQLRWMAQRVYAGADLVIANSESTRRIVLDLAPSAKIVCIAPGVDAQSFVVPDAQIVECRASWGWSAGTVVVGTVARMEARKNQAGVLRAIAELRRVGVDVAYVCAGDGQERAALTQLASDLGIADRVRFPGPVSEAQKRLLFASVDIHAMPSVQIGEMIEGFGIVFLEAAASGVPSICGDSGGQTEAVRNGETGLVVDGRDPANIAAALKTLAVDSELRRLMGRNGRRFAADFDWAQVCARTLDATSSLI
ncbi:MAG: glycosyltransferase family 4 protein [Pseudomonadota bacterium]